jgi:hypothetical protein
MKLGSRCLMQYDYIRESAIVVTVTDIRYGNVRVWGWDSSGACVEAWVPPDKLTLLPEG